MLETNNNLERVRQARKAKHDVLLVPVLDGKLVQLEYRRGTLPLEKFTPKQQQMLKEARVPTVVGYQPGRWAHFKCQSVIVRLVLSQRQFIAVDALPSCGTVTNRLSTLNLLHKSGFRTPLGYVKWLNVVKAKHRSEVEDHLRSYIDEVNKALAEKKALNGATSNFTVPQAVAVEVEDILGFQPDPRLGARAQSVYKLVGEF